MTPGLRRLRDSVLLAGTILTGALSRRSVRPRGDEARHALPGDDPLPRANDRWTHGITIRARPQQIWPWLAQMGYRRARWYSYDGLEAGALHTRHPGLA